MFVFITEQNPSKLGKTLASLLEGKEYPRFEKKFSCSKNENFLNFIMNIILKI